MGGLGSIKSLNYPSYDDDGRLAQMNVGGASYDYTYSYDLAGRFEKIKLTSNGSVQFQYAYDPASNETDRYANLPNSVDIQQHYNRDSLNRMGSRVVKKNGTTFTTEAYTYDHMNRITEVTGEGRPTTLVIIGMASFCSPNTEAVRMRLITKVKTRTWTPPTTLILTRAINRRIRRRRSPRRRRTTTATRLWPGLFRRLYSLDVR